MRSLELFCLVGREGLDEVQGGKLMDKLYIDFFSLYIVDIRPFT